MTSDILRKIRGLLKLGESDNPNEAASAVAMAARLMERHAITETAVELSEADPATAEEIKSFEEPLGASGSWRSRLALALAKANGCSTWRTGNQLRLIGRPSGAEKVRYLFSYCSKEIDRITRKNTRGEGRTYANNYRIGMVDAIAEAIIKEREGVRAEMRTEAQERGSSALVVVNNAIAVIDRGHEDSRAFGRRKLGLVRGGGSRSRYDPNARGEGKAAGAGVYPGGASGGGIGSGRRQLGRG
ncbi:MAG: DUF2786 domain-containing protein [Deltaproteobacteria bacterium]|nr:DUF2786 domain-containing protein [Deltaproteobacteria bacterium]